MQSLRRVILLSVGFVLTALGLAAQQRGTFVQQAFLMRQRAVDNGDQPYGAVVVKDGRIVGEGVSAVVTGTDPTAHAEMQAIRDAARRLGTADLEGCELYGTSRACPMCEAAAYFTRVSRLYYGPVPTDAGAPKLPSFAVEPGLDLINQELITAAGRGEVRSLRRALERGAQVDARDARGRTALLAATQANRVEAVQALLAAGADVDLQDERLDNPFLYAGAEGLLEILKLLIDARADPRLTNRFGGTALIPACERGHVEVVRELLTRTAVAVNHVNNLGWTALLEAVVLGNGGVPHQQVVRLLVDHGADVNIGDRNGVTPLGHARARGFMEIEHILLRAGAR